MKQDPLKLFSEWFERARAHGLPSPETMTLATATKRGVPSARQVLLRDVSRGGFVFFTNYESRKARELESNPRAALVMHWEPLGLQVRVEGRVARVSKAESDRYFASRERGRQIGAWASRQSRPIADRETLERQVAEIAARFEGKPVPRPPFWGGYRILPERIEFWTLREHRLHDRILYERKSGRWKVARLSP
jgi:pyridoxamine 5'-phosphate oxidase